MKKRILAAVLASASILGAVAGCSSNATSSARIFYNRFEQD